MEKWLCMISIYIYISFFFSLSLELMGRWRKEGRNGIVVVIASYMYTP